MQEMGMYMMMASMMSMMMCGASYVLAMSSPESEKVSAYECGFDPFQDTREKFEISFFLVGMLFMMFDLEMSLLFPWAQVMTVMNYWMMMGFLGMLTMGFMYEWQSGALEWE